MALTYTPPGEIGSSCPDFSLKSVDGKKFSLKDFETSKVLVLMFICNHCPYVMAIEDRLIALAHEFSKKNVQFLGVCSNNPKDYPEDQPEALLQRWKTKNYGFPYLIDTEQELAKAAGAVCTPDLFVFDQQRKLQYRGRLDDSWKDPALVKKQELKIALELLLNNKAAPTEQRPSMGCSIKW